MGTFENSVNSAGMQHFIWVHTVNKDKMIFNDWNFNICQPYICTYMYNEPSLVYLPE